jgi:hypothetical protein
MSRGHWQCRVLQVAGKVWTASEAATGAKSLRENQVLYGTAAEAVPFHDQVLTSFKARRIVNLTARLKPSFSAAPIQQYPSL